MIEFHTGIEMECTVTIFYDGWHEFSEQAVHAARQHAIKELHPYKPTIKIMDREPMGTRGEDDDEEYEFSDGIEWMEDD